MQEEEGVKLPNFKVAREVRTQWILDIIDSNLPPEVKYRGYVAFEEFTFGFDELELKLMVNLRDILQPIVSLVKNHEYQLPRKVIDGIRFALRNAISDEIAKCGKKVSVFDFGLIILRLIEETTSFLLDYRRGILRKTLKEKETYWDLRKINNLDPLLDHKLKMKGLDLETVHGAASHILGKTPAQICADIDPNYRILHCENILRSDLASKFLQYQQTLRDKLMRVPVKDLKAFVPREKQRRYGDGQAAKEQLVEHLTKTRTTFHGTRRDLVPSIVQHGFLKPGDIHPATKKRLPVSNGTAYGRGIYSSPKAWYALSYTGWGQERTKPSELPGMKLLVCATVMGRTACLERGDDWWELDEPLHGADSHVNESQWAYIVFNSAQILPCYVIHLDWAPAEEDGFYQWFMRTMSGVPSKKPPAKGDIGPGEKQRNREQLIARGQKFFAYGYGPVDGKKLIIEDVAEVDDDEEEYGEYQETRIDARPANTSIWDTHWGKEDEGTEQDVWNQFELEGETEYSSARRANLNRRNLRSS